MSFYQTLSQDQLRQMYKTKGSLLLIDVPQGLQFGIDNIIWKTGNKFRGLKFIPLGCHIISYTLKNQNNMFKINKFIIFSQQNPIQIYKWHQYYSIFVQLKGSQAQGYREGVKHFHFDSYLGPYPEDNLQFWKDNMRFITKEVLGKLDPVEKIYKFDEEYQKKNKKKGKQIQQFKIDVDQESDDGNDQVEIVNQMENQVEMLEEQIDNVNLNQQQTQTNNQQYTKNTDKLNKKFQPLSDTIYYSQIPRILTNDPNHINKINMDKTQILLQVIVKQWKHYYVGLLGQIQYSFIYFLIGQDQESFNQWKKLIDLVVFSQELFCQKQYAQLILSEDKVDQNKIKIIENFQKLSLQFIVVIFNQLKQFPVDFFVDQLSKGNFFEKCLKRLKSYSLPQSQASQHISKKVKRRLQKLFKLLQQKFSYQIQAQDIDDQQKPIIVDYQNQSYF